jgi:AbrB family looped-hinge helix DNA binding protein
MAIGRSKLSSRGQISLPLGVRKKLGVRPGSVLEWDQKGNDIVLRGGKFTSEDIRRSLFPNGPPKRRSLKALKKGVEDYIREQHAARRKRAQQL